MGLKESNQTNKQNMAIFNFSRIPKYRYVKGSQIKASNIVFHLLNVFRLFILMKSRVPKEYDEIGETSGHPNYRQEPTRADKNRQEIFYILIH